MENITASFRNWTEMEQAVTALRAQGAIDIQVEPDVSSSTLEAITPSLQQGLMERADLGEWNEQGYILQVVVESSRSRQAADTIAKFGGQR